MRTKFFNYCFTFCSMRSALQSSCCTAILIFMSFGMASAQQNGSQNSLLPEIDPQDIEIRSEFKARFPGLRRQPILGFNPTPRVYQIDPGRTPFMETREQVIASVPVTGLTRPSPPQYRALQYNPEINGYGRIGVGSFISPEAELWGVYELSEKSYLNGSLDFLSSDGHLDNQKSSFRFFDADVQFATKLDQNKILKFNVGALSDFNYLVQVPGTPASTTFGEGRKDYTGINVDTEFKHIKNSIEGWSIKAGIQTSNTDLDAGSLSGQNEEIVFHGRFNKEWTGKHLHETFTVSASARGGQYTPDSGLLDDQPWSTVRAGLTYERLFDFSTRLTAEAALAYASDAVEDAVYAAPSVEIKHWIQDDLTITGTISAAPYHTSQQQHHQINRFYQNTSLLRHTYQIDGNAEVAFDYLEGSRLYGGISYMRAQNYPYYMLTSRTDAGGTEAIDFYAIAFMDADRLKGYAGVSHQLIPEKLWINARAYIQNPELDNGNEIPFEEQWGINTSIALQVADRLQLEGWADYVGERKTLSSAGDVDGFLLIGGRVDVDITDKIGIYAKIVNLLNEEYEVWKGYEERPFQAYGGITVRIK